MATKRPKAREVAESTADPRFEVKHRPQLVLRTTQDRVAGVHPIAEDLVIGFEAWFAAFDPNTLRLEAASPGEIDLWCPYAGLRACATSRATATKRLLKLVSPASVSAIAPGLRGAAEDLSLRVFIAIACNVAEQGEIQWGAFRVMDIDGYSRIAELLAKLLAPAIAPAMRNVSRAIAASPATGGVQALHRMLAAANGMAKSHATIRARQRRGSKRIRGDSDLPIMALATLWRSIVGRRPASHTTGVFAEACNAMLPRFPGAPREPVQGLDKRILNALKPSRRARP